MPYSTSARKWTAGGLGVPDLNQFNSDLRSDLGAPMPPGAALARALAARFADTLYLLDYILPVDADATNGFLRVFARVQALNGPVVIEVPAKQLDISGAIALTLSGAAAIHLRGAGGGVSVIRQLADADGFAAVLGNYGPGYGQGGCFNVSGLSLLMACPTASATRTALSLSTTGYTGNTGVPLAVDDVVIAGTFASPSGWGTGIRVSAFANTGRISRATIYTSGTGIALTGNNQSYTTDFAIRDVSIFGAAVALRLGDYLQGIRVDNLFTVNTTYAVRSEPTLAAGDNAYVFTRCYLYGKTVFHGLEGVVAHFQVQVSDCYFDGNVNGPGATIDKHVSFVNVPQVTITGCTFNGARPPAATPISGLYIENQSYDTIVSNCTLGGYGAPGDGSTSCAVVLAASTGGIVLSGNVFDYNARAISDLGTGNIIANTRIDRCEAGGNGYWCFGTGKVPPGVPALFAGTVAADDLNVGGTGGMAGAWTSAAVAVSASSGTLSAAGATLRYKKFGRTVLMCVSVGITTNGTAAGTIQVTLPFANNAASYSVLAGRELSTTGKSLTGFLAVGSSTLVIQNYDNSYPAANGATLLLEGIYEAAS